MPRRTTWVEALGSPVLSGDTSLVQQGHRNSKSPIRAFVIYKNETRDETSTGDWG